MPKEKITIIGLGVIGGSYAIALKKLGYTVYGADCDEDTVSQTMRRPARTRLYQIPTSWLSRFIPNRWKAN